VSLESDLQRELRARASSLRVSPDLDDLSSRLQRVATRVEHRDRLLVGGAAVVLALAVGGLAGALATRPNVRPGVAEQSRGVIVPGAGHHPRQRPRRFFAAPGGGARDVRLSLAGVSLLATERPLASPVAVTTQWSSRTTCNPVELVTTTAGRSGAFAGGTGVVGLPPLGPSGFEVVDSGDLPTATGADVWWLTAAVGSSVARVAAEGPGGQVAAAAPHGGLALLAGVEPTGVAGPREISAVAENGLGHSLASLGVLIGSGPKAVGEQVPDWSSASSAAGRHGASQAAAGSCDVVRLPPAVPSVTASLPADPRLAAAAVVTAYEEAFQGALVNPTTVGPATGEYAMPLPGVTVREVSFLTATRAEVVYRVTGGLWRTGLAVLTGGSRWTVSDVPECEVATNTTSVSANETSGSETTGCPPG
jgi:hypothetical protein